MSVWLFDSKAFGHLREGGQKVLGAPGPGGMAFFLSGPLVPRVENGAHKAYCPFSLKGSGGRYKNEGGAPHKGQTRCNGNLVTHTPPHLLHVGPTGRDRGATYT